MPRPYSWDQLGRLTLRRQFPSIRGRGPSAVVELVRRVGPIQSQVARAPFVTVASRLPGAGYADIVAAYESFELLRGSNLRGTVHTCVADQHPLLDSVTRRTLENLWRRSLKLERCSVADVRAAIERYASGDWRNPDELRVFLAAWLSEHEGPAAAKAASTAGVGRAMAHIHSALVRRPLASRAWERQTSPGYRLASDVIAEPQPDWSGDPDAALVSLTRVHLTAFGPANRRDIAWWTGEGLRHVDAAIAALGDDVSARPGPDGQDYYDLVARPSGGNADPGVRLLPEYDALVVGYDPASRERFLDPDHLGLVWQLQNGQFSAAVLADGRLSGTWRLTAGQRGRDASARRLDVSMFPGRRMLTESDLAEQVSALQAALAITIVGVSVARAG